MCQRQLHMPSRELELHDLEDHIECCANVSRSLWLLLAQCEVDLCDQRNYDAMKELANIIADNASAARRILQQK